MKRKKKNKQDQCNYSKSPTRGFTIVELLIVIVVIAILAAIIVVAYLGMQARAIDTKLTTDLNQAHQAMEIAKIENDDTYPDVLPSNLSSLSGGNGTGSSGSSQSSSTLALKKGGTASYSNLTASQNGLLFFNTCLTLISEGVGAKPDDGHNYISECRVYSKSAINIQGWNAKDVPTPVTVAALTSYVTSYSGGSSDEFKQKAQNFMSQLESRFISAGGTFPVTQFWDNWATSTNGGVVKPTLLSPTTSGGNTNGVTA